MGVYGCCPAYDTYFRKAISKYGINVTQKGHPNISNLIKNINQNDTFKDKINKATQKLSDPYTKMKVIDIIFWQIGKELIEKEMVKKKNEIKS